MQINTNYANLCLFKVDIRLYTVIFTNIRKTHATTKKCKTTNQL